MRWLRSLVGVLRPGRRIVGTDLDGNTYIEVNSSRGGKPRREVLTKLKHSQYEDGSIPVEWEAWIRGKRDDPPTHEELFKKMQQREVIKQKAKKLEEEKEKKRMKDIDKNTLHGWTSGAAHYTPSHGFGQPESTTQPTRSGDSFQPGAWVPSQGGRGKAEVDPKQTVGNSSDNNKSSHDGLDFQSTDGFHDVGVGGGGSGGD